MNLYLISQDVNDNYDTYDSAVVVAKSLQDAREIHPSGYHTINGQWVGTYADSGEWVSFSDIDCIKVEYLGETKKERGVILASFNAG